MKKEILDPRSYIVMGANWGDEGKGHTIDHIIKNLLSSYPKELNKEKDFLGIKSNGGPQMGHTSNNHVYRTFCSGDINTYLSRMFLFNPRSYLQEVKALTSKYQEAPHKIYVNCMCRITTPIDILLNRIAETARDYDKKHGSTGMGINATIERNKHIPLTINDLINATPLQKQEFTRQMFHYYHGFRNAIDNFPYRYSHHDYEISELMNTFWDECDKALDQIIVIYPNEEVEFLNKYKIKIFEMGQGLMLDRDNEKFYPYLTPTKTNATYPMNILSSTDFISNQVIPVYVTRTYTTKHGAGEFPLEIKTEAETFKKFKEQVEEIDLTNIPNQWQGSMRIGMFDPDIFKRIEEDHRNIKLQIATTPHRLSDPYLKITWSDITGKNILMQNGEFQSWSTYYTDANHNNINIEFI